MDERLCGLVDRLRAMGYRHTLEVELRLVEIRGDPEEYDLTTLFPALRDKGSSPSSTLPMAIGLFILLPLIHVEVRVEFMLPFICMY